MPDFDVIVVGSGHAGCEAALAAARMGCRVAVITLSIERTAHMPCNCSIGGPAKGHLVREIDALGGQMGVNIDRTLTHIRHVGTGKGPAVRTLRAHADKAHYPAEMLRTLQAQENLTLIQGSVEGLVVREGVCVGVKFLPSPPCPLSHGVGEGELASQHRASKHGLRPDLSHGVGEGELASPAPTPWERGAGGEGAITLTAPAVVITTGTFLNGLCHIGEQKIKAARFGDQPSVGLTECLRQLGFRIGRFKTGTTPRIDKKSVDLSQLQEVPSEPCPPFSYLHDALNPPRPLLPCWQTYTNERTHAIIRANLHLSAMYGGHITGVGPRYCPSIEDKIVRFPDKDRHPVFLEQEYWDADDLYVQGMSTSLPAEAQLEFLRTLPGLEEAAMIRPGYAVEYDMVYPDQLYPTLMTKRIRGLFLAGQINGTSGYEEAAAQGLVAGINAALCVQKREPLVLDRASSYIGVLIDDLVTKGVEDPYRMLTGRAEHRLHLRHDNADERLTPIARELGLACEERWRRFRERQDWLNAELDTLRGLEISGRHNPQLQALGGAPVNARISALEYLRRPEASYAMLQQLFPDALRAPEAIAERVEIIAKYEVYLRKQQQQIEQMRKVEHWIIPDGIDYESLSAISKESREKLSRVRPRTIGQAARIPGIRPADVACLMVYLRSREK